MAIFRKTVRMRYRFYGEVQAVGFRWTALTAAKNEGATGWVKNEPDGSVSMEIQGTEKQISRVLTALEQDKYIRIDRVETKQLQKVSGEKSFQVSYLRRE